MVSGVVVVVESGCVGVAVFLVGGEGSPVGPSFLQGAVEAFGFAVLSGRVWSGQDVCCLERGEHGLEVAGVTVVQRVVGHDLADAASGEELGGLGEERGAGRALLIRQDVGGREPGVVVDGDVEVVHAKLGRPGPAAVVVDCVRPVEPLAATVGDAAEFLHIDVDQGPGLLAFIVQLRAAGCTDPDTGHGIELVQRWQSGAGDDPRRRRRADPDTTRQLVPTQPFGSPQLQQPCRNHRGHRPRMRAGARNHCVSAGDGCESTPDACGRARADLVIPRPRVAGIASPNGERTTETPRAPWQRETPGAPKEPAGQGPSNRPQPASRYGGPKEGLPLGDIRHHPE